MYNKESNHNTHGFRHSDCRNEFRSRFGEAFSGAPWSKRIRKRMAAHKSVNIEETDDHYVLSLYAAGLKKELFSLSVKNDVLTIRYQTGPQPESSRFVHEEYQPTDFQRSFLLNGKVVTESISAAYTDGVLQVTLPKNPEAKEPAQHISVG